MTKYRLKGTSGALINQSFPLAGKLLIGSADDCDIRMKHDSVAAHHAEILLSEDGGVHIRNLDSDCETLVNGVAVANQDLSGGDEIQIGNCRLMLQAPGLRPERVLDTDAIQAPARHWPWLLAALLAAAGIMAWQYGFLDRLMGMFSS